MYKFQLFLVLQVRNSITRVSLPNINIGSTTNEPRSRSPSVGLILVLPGQISHSILWESGMVVSRMEAESELLKYQLPKMAQQSCHLLVRQLQSHATMA